MKRKGQGWYGERERHSEVQIKVATKNILRQPITYIKYPIIKIRNDALNQFINNESGELSSNGIAVALRTPNFVFISKDIAPHQLPDLYHRIDTAYSGGAVSLGLEDGTVIVKNIDEEKRKHEQAIAKAGNNISIQMHVQILKALKEIEGHAATQTNSFPQIVGSHSSAEHPVHGEKSPLDIRGAN